MDLFSPANNLASDYLTAVCFAHKIGVRISSHADRDVNDEL